MKKYSYYSVKGREEIVSPHSQWCKSEEVDRLEKERDAYRSALLAHRADLHNYSSRPCPTCRKSAESLGIKSKVPNSCARGDWDLDALKEE